MTGRRRRLLTRGAAVGGGLALVFVGALAALGVHDESFQLEGNAAAADLSYTDIDKVGNATTTTPGTLTGALAGPWDWDSLFNISGTPTAGTAGGTVTGNKNPLPSNADGTFTAADFEKDFNNSGTTFQTFDTTTFATGSKDTLPISGWQCNRDNNVNSKTDIINGYAAIQERSNGQKILYFGLEKDVDNGDNNVGFWLLQDVTVGCVSPGGAVTFTGAHQEGDLFAVSAFTNGGGISSVTLYEWVNDAEAKPGLQPGINPNPVVVSGDCLDTDPTADTGSDRACAAVNGKTIHMPWLSADSGVINADKVSPNFFEGAIDLTAFDEFDDTCFNSFILNTRSSQELGATLFDYVRGSLSTCRPNIGITKTPDSGTYFVGESFNWTVDVTNSGNGAATNQVVTDTIATGLTINSASYDMDPNTAGGTGNCTVNGQNVSCTIPTIAASDGNTTGAEPDVARITINVTVGSGVFGTSTDGCVPVNNTATTGSVSDTGQVTACRLTVTKTATPSFTRTHTWSITKSVAPDSHSLFDGQSATSTYTIGLDKTTTDSAWAVAGSITVSNPANKAATVGAVTDSITGGVTGTVVCPAGATSIAANSTLVCSYTASLSDATTRTNTASVTAYGQSYSGTASINFSGVSPTVVGYDQINVDDTNDDGDNGPISSDTSYNYTRVFDCSDIEYVDGVGTINYPNTATIEETGQDADADVDVTCYRLSVSKDATPSFGRKIEWTITKDVDDPEHSLFDGQTATSTYTISVDKTVTDSGYAVDGTITITNPAPMAATVTSLTDDISDLAGDPTPDCSGATEVAANDTLECTYSSDLPDNTTRTNTATLTAYGVEYTSNAASIDFTGVTPTVDGPDQINVDDTNDGGDKGPISDDDTYTYSRTFDCSGEEYTDGVATTNYPNTATITETGASDDAEVDVTCYRLAVSKDADTTFKRTYSWEITKTGSTSSETVDKGTTVTVTYTVHVDKTTVDSDWAVSGTITISNPAPMAASITSLTDDISGVANDPTPDCGGATEVPAESSIECSYSKSLSDGDDRKNTATLTAYGVTYTSNEAAVDFGDPTTVVGFDTINVTDTYAGDLGSASGDKDFTYEREFDTSTMSCGTHSFPNTATIEETDQSDDWNVDITVTGCGGNLFHTGTTCDQYLGNTPPVGLAGTQITEAQYSVKSGKISQVNPGVFFYYSTVTAPSSSFTALVDETVVHPSFTTAFLPQNLSNIRVFDADCDPVTSFTATWTSGGDVTLNITGATSGDDYIISIKYETSNVVGKNAPHNPTTVHYDFATKVGGVVVDEDEDGLDLVKK